MKKILNSLIILSLFGLVGCANKTSYTIKWQYVNPNDSKEVRTVEGELTERGFTNKTILVNFPRTLKLLNKELIWNFKKKK